MYGGVLQDLIDEFGRLPGVGPKSAQRMAFHVLEAEDEEVGRLVTAIQGVKEKVLFCSSCFNVSEEETCTICANSHRDASQICVVEAPKDIQAIEKTHSYNGRYHVLGGAINPMSGVGPDQLRIRELVTRLGGDTVRELILATNPNLEGEATATYLVRLLTNVGLTISRLASGLPVGGDLEYADEITLGLAFEGRRIVSGQLDTVGNVPLSIDAG